jgi:hypothetical protein
VKRGEGRFSATHCMTANGEERRNVHEAREKSGYRRCRCVHFHIYFSHEIVQVRQALRSALARNLKWLLYVPPGSQKDSTFCIQSECKCCRVFSTNSGFFLRLRSELGPGLHNRIVFRLWSGRPGAEIPQRRQGPVADHSHKFGAGAKNDWSYIYPYMPSWSVYGEVVLFALLTDWILKPGRTECVYCTV